MAHDFARLGRHLGYSYTDVELLTQALSHRSTGKNNNERLEFLGDAVLSFIITRALYQRFPTAPEGQLSQMRAKLVKGKTLAAIAKEFALGDFLILGGGELKSGGHRRESILADALEALIGAMYLDGGIDVTRERVLQWYGPRLDAIKPSDHAHKDAKTSLQELLQSRKFPVPTYNLVDTRGSEHQQIFEVECSIEPTTQTFSGQGSSRRAAEQVAAASALDFLEQSGF